MVQVRYIHNRSLDKLQFPGGYVSFSTNNTPDWHYFIQDYMGNVRMVVNSDGTVEQKTHYYPYGGVIGNLSTNHGHQLAQKLGKLPLGNHTRTRYSTPHSPYKVADVFSTIKISNK